MFFHRRRVEEDLERIRKANLPSPPGEAKTGGTSPNRPEKRGEDRIGVKDILAMIIAIFSIILPYVLVFVGIIGLVLLLLYYFWG